MHETKKYFFYLITDFQTSLDIQLIVTLTLKDILLLMQKMAISRQQKLWIGKKLLGIISLSLQLKSVSISLRYFIINGINSVVF